MGKCLYIPFRRYWHTYRQNILMDGGGDFQLWKKKQRNNVGSKRVHLGKALCLFKNCQGWYFSNFNVYTNDLGIIGKLTFSSEGQEWGLILCIPKKKTARWCWHILASKDLTEENPGPETCLHLSVLFSKFMSIKFTYICKMAFTLYLNNNIVSPKIALLIINLCIKFCKLG